MRRCPLTLQILYGVFLVPQGEHFWGGSGRFSSLANWSNTANLKPVLEAGKGTFRRLPKTGQYGLPERLSQSLPRHHLYDSETLLNAIRPKARIASFESGDYRHGSSILGPTARRYRIQIDPV